MEEDKIAFLQALVHVLEDRTTKLTIYRKPTDTDQYLNFESNHHIKQKIESNHHIKQKIGIISTFEHSIEELVTTEEDKKKGNEPCKKSPEEVRTPKLVAK